ncbi:MAG: hypothetical protein WC718_18640, partial [Phycisphaerales bacterium]
MMLAPAFRQINAALFLILAAVPVGGLLPLRAADSPPRNLASAERGALPKARVVRASDPQAVHLLAPDPVRVR